MSDERVNPPAESPASVPALRAWGQGFGRFSRRLLAVAITLFFLAVTLFGFGAGLNVPSLVWYEWESVPWEQVLTGFSVTMLLLYAWLVTFVLDLREQEGFLRQPPDPRWWQVHILAINLIISRRAALAGGAGEQLRWYLSVTWLPAVVLLIVATFLEIRQRWPFLVGIGLALLSVWVLAFALRALLRNRVGREQANLTPDRWLRGLAEFFFVGVAAIYLIMLALYYSGWVIPPSIFSACLLLGVMVGVSGAVWYYLRSWALLAFVGLVALVLASTAREHRLRFPGLRGSPAGEDYYSEDKLRPLQEENPPLLAVEPGSETEAQEKARVTALIKRSYRQWGKSEDEIPDLSGHTYDQLVLQYYGLIWQIDSSERGNLDAWRSQFVEDRPTAVPGSKPPLVVVTVTGGASRSALWTARVLEGLDRALTRSGEDKPNQKNFARHVRVITGASGGMLGAAHYACSVTEDGLPGDYDPEIVVGQERDYLTPVVNSVVFREIPYLLWPFSGTYEGDRGEALGLAMERSLPGLKQSFQSLSAGERAGWRPSLIFSPMLIEDGRRLLITNLNLPLLTENRGNISLPGPSPRDSDPGQTPNTKQIPPVDDVGRLWARPTDLSMIPELLFGSNRDRYSISALELFRMFPEARDDVHVSTAVRMSASFPFVSPATDLPTDPPLRVVDAGYYDNYGVNLASAWIYHHRDWLLRNTSGVLLIQIRDFKRHENRRRMYQPPEDEDFPLVPSFLSAPIEGGLSARSSVMAFRNDEQLVYLSDYFNRTAPADFFTTVVFERPDEKTGLSWYLSDEDVKTILKGWESPASAGYPETVNGRTLDILTDWWNRH